MIVSPFPGSRLSLSRGLSLDRELVRVLVPLPVPGGAPAASALPVDALRALDQHRSLRVPSNAQQARHGELFRVAAALEEVSELPAPQDPVPKAERLADRGQDCRSVVFIVIAVRGCVGYLDIFEEVNAAGLEAVFEENLEGDELLAVRMAPVCFAFEYV